MDKLSKKLFVIIIILLLTLGIITCFYINTFKKVNTSTFYATIQDINEYKGKFTIYVKGLEINDINFRGEYSFPIKSTTDLVWHGTNLEISDLKVGQNISVTFDGIVLTTSPGQIQNVFEIKVLDDEI